MVILIALLTAAGAQAQPPRPIPTPGGATFTSVPITNQMRDGSVLHGGARFYFRDPPRRMTPLGEAMIVEPRDGPHGEQDFPGERDCTKSASLALTALATKIRELGGDAMVNIRTDTAVPDAKGGNAIVCQMGRVVLRGTVISTR
jgi:hypothetical protein